MRVRQVLRSTATRNSTKPHPQTDVLVIDLFFSVCRCHGVPDSGEPGKFERINGVSILFVSAVFVFAFLTVVGIPSIHFLLKFDVIDRKSALESTCLGVSVTS